MDRILFPTQQKLKLLLETWFTRQHQHQRSKHHTSYVKCCLRSINDRIFSQSDKILFIFLKRSLLELCLTARNALILKMDNSTVHCATFLNVDDLLYQQDEWRFSCKIFKQKSRTNSNIEWKKSEREIHRNNEQINFYPNIYIIAMRIFLSLNEWVLQSSILQLWVD